ncbi:hypothetical protein D3C80_1015170 [compost metagenome]
MLFRVSLGIATGEIRSIKEAPHGAMPDNFCVDQVVVDPAERCEQSGDVADRQSRAVLLPFAGHPHALDLDGPGRVLHALPVDRTNLGVAVEVVDIAAQVSQVHLIQLDILPGRELLDVLVNALGHQVTWCVCSKVAVSDHISPP